MDRRLAILKAEWTSEYKHSIKPFFEGLSFYMEKERRTDGFHYERFVGEQSFEESLKFLIRKTDVRYLYIATHGNSQALSCPDRGSISRGRLHECLEDANSGTQLDGLLLGSCLIGNEKTANKLLKSDVPAPQRLKWVAGYSKSADWLASTLLDVLFLSYVIEFREEKVFPPAQSVKLACERLINNAEQLTSKLGFHVYVRTQRSGEVRDLLKIVHEDPEI